MANPSSFRSHPSRRLIPIRRSDTSRLPLCPQRIGRLPPERRPPGLRRLQRRQSLRKATGGQPSFCLCLRREERFCPLRCLRGTAPYPANPTSEGRRALAHRARARGPLGRSTPLSPRYTIIRIGSLETYLSATSSLGTPCLSRDLSNVLRLGSTPTTFSPRAATQQSGLCSRIRGMIDAR